ncbi:unnamed protein product [Camellia sinensis]
MASVLGTSSVALFASRPSSSRSSKCPIHSLSPTPGQSYGRKFYGGIVIPVKKERSQFRVSITNVATEISPEIKVVAGDPFNSDPEVPESMGMEVQERVVRGEEVPLMNTKINIVVSYSVRRSS